MMMKKECKDLNTDDIFSSCTPKIVLPQIAKPSSTIANMSRKKPASVAAEEITSERIESRLLNLKYCKSLKKIKSALIATNILNVWWSLPSRVN